MLLAPRRVSATSGFALVDVCVALAILAIAMGALVGTVFWAMRLSEVNEETAAASQEVRALLERLSQMPVDEVYRSYNADASDDPAPGTDTLAELEIDDPLLFVGHESAPKVSIAFPGDPVAEVAAGRLNVSVRLDWGGTTGERSLSMSTLLRGP